MKKLTETEKQLKELDEFIASTEPTSDDWCDLMEKKEKLMEIAKVEAEAAKANAEAKATCKIDVNGIIKIVGVGALGLLAVGLNEGRILSNNPLWKKFCQLF